MSLRDLIINIEEWESKTPQELLDIVSAMSREVRDDQMYTWSGVALLVGPANAEILRLTLESSGAGWAVHQLGGSGIQLSNELTQGMLSLFVQNGLAFCQILKDKGIHTEPVVNATLQDVNNALLAIRKDSLINTNAQRWNDFVAAVNAWDGSGNEPTL